MGVLAMAMARKGFLLQTLGRRSQWDYVLARMWGPGRRVWVRWHTNYGPGWQARWWGCPQWSKRGVAGKAWCGEDYKFCLILIEFELTDSRLQEMSGKQAQSWSWTEETGREHIGGSAIGCTEVVAGFVFADEITQTWKGAESEGKEDEVQRNHHRK